MHSPLRTRSSIHSRVLLAIVTALVLTPLAAHAQYDAGVTAGRAACKGGKTPAAYPEVASPLTGDRAEAYRGWWDGCNFEWNIPQDWRLVPHGPVARASTGLPAVDLAVYNGGYNDGIADCTPVSTRFVVKRGDRPNDYKLGYSHACDALGRRAAMKKSGAAATALWRTGYDVCYRNRKAPDGLYGPRDPLAPHTSDGFDMYFGCVAALNDLVQGIPHRFDAPTPRSPAKLFVDGPSPQEFAAQSARDRAEFTTGYNEGRSNCASNAFGNTAGHPDLSTHPLPYLNGWDVGCIEFLKEFQVAHPKTPTPDLPYDYVRYGLIQTRRETGRQRGESECRFGRTEYGQPDSLAFGRDFFDGWQDGCNATLDRYRKAGVAFQDAGIWQFKRPYGAYVATPAPPPKPPAAVPQRTVYAVPATSTAPAAAQQNTPPVAINDDPPLAGPEPLTQGDLLRRAHLVRMETARDQLAEWRAQKLVGLTPMFDSAAYQRELRGIRDGIAAYSGRDLSSEPAREVVSVSPTANVDAPARERSHDATRYAAGRSAGARACTQGKIPATASYPSTRTDGEDFYRGWWDACHDEWVTWGGTLPPASAAKEVARYKAHELKAQEADRILGTSIQVAAVHQAKPVEAQQSRTIDAVDAREATAARTRDIDVAKARDVEVVRAQPAASAPARDITVERASEIAPRQSQTVQPVGASVPEQVKAREIETHNARAVEATKAKEIEPYKAKEIQVYKSNEIEPYKAKEIEPYSAREITPVTARTLEQSAAPAGASTFVGTARNGSYSGTMRVAVSAPDANGRVTAQVTFSNGLSGSGAFTGTFRGGELQLTGTLVDGGTSYPTALVARIDGSGSLAGAYRLQAGGTTQSATFTLPPEARAAAPSGVGGGASGAQRMDPRIAGSWALVIQGGSWTSETDYGSFTQRVQHASSGAPGGALTVAADGSYTWKKPSGTSRGRVEWFTSKRGNSGWLVKFDGEPFYIQYADGKNGGLYLFSPATDFWVYSGIAIR